MRFTLLLSLFILSTALGAQITFSGNLKNDGDEFVEYALVRIGEKETASGKNGYFRIDLDSMGSYLVEIKSIGYKDYKTEITIQSTLHVQIQLEDEIYNLESVELISSWIKSNQPFTYTNLSKEKIEQKNLGQDVPFLLRWTPSTVVTSDAGTGIGYSGIRIRGSDPSRINVTIDGIPVNDAESQGVFWVDLPDFASSVDAIQIQRGVGTSTHGAGAFGGTINLKTEGVQTKPYVSLSGSAGSYTTNSGKIELGTGLFGNHFSLDGRISKVNSAGYIDRGSSDLNSLYFSGKYIDQEQALKLNFFTGKEITYQAWNGVPAQYIDKKDLRTYNTAGMKTDGSFHDDEVDNYRQSHWHAIYNRSFSKGASAKVAVHYTKGKGYFEQYRNEDPLFDYQIPEVNLGDTIIRNSDLIRRRWLDNDFLGGIFSLHLEPSQKLEINVGGGVNRYWGSHFGEVIWSRVLGDSEQNHEYYRDKARKDDLNLYLQIQQRFGTKWHGLIDLQGRKINYQFLGYNEQLEPSETEESLFFFNPKFGLTYKGDTYDWYYSFSIGHREPNRDDYVNSTPTSRPKPERLIDHELGIRINGKRTFLGLNTYYMHYRDQLILTGKINDVGEYIRTNVDHSFRTGIEIEFNYAPLKNFALQGSSTVSANRIRSFLEYIDNWDTWGQEEKTYKNTQIAFSPSVIAQGGLAYTIAEKDRINFTAEWLTKFVGKQYLDNTKREQSSLDPYFFSDLHLHCTFRPKWAKAIGLKLQIRNIFDQDVISNGWIYRFISENYDARPDDPYAILEEGSTYNLTGYYPQAGINFLLGVSIHY